MKLNHSKWIDRSVYLLVGVLVTIFVFTNAEKQIAFKKEKHISLSKSQFQTIIHSEQKRAERFYDDHADNIAKTINGVNNFSAAKKQNIREQLLDQYQSFFAHAQNQGLGVLHIFDADGNSFLRFHKPERSGDNLIDLRHSLKELLTKHKYTKA